MEEKDTAARGKLRGMIKRYRFAMMTARHAGDALRSRPLATGAKSAAPSDNLRQ